MNKIIEYIKRRDKELDNIAVVDDGTYSSAKETYRKLINILEDTKDKLEEETIDNDIVEIISHTYYADNRVIRIETDYKYKE